MTVNDLNEKKEPIYDDYIEEDPFGLEVDSDFQTKRISTTIKIIKNLFGQEAEINILDIGCGKGVITGRVNQVFPLSKIFGIDVSPKAIAYCREKYKDIHFDIISGENYKYKDRLFDVILFNNIYEHLENPTTVLKNIRLLLSPKGSIIISTPNRYHVINILRGIIGKSIATSKHHTTEYTIGQMKEQIKYSGLQLSYMLFPEIKYSNKNFLWNATYSVIKSILNLYIKFVKSNYSFNPLAFYIIKLPIQNDNNHI